MNILIFFLFLINFIFAKKINAQVCNPATVTCTEQISEDRCGGISSGWRCDYDDDCDFPITCDPYFYDYIYTRDCTYSSSQGDCLGSCDPGIDQTGQCGNTSVPPPPNCPGVCCDAAICLDEYVGNTACGSDKCCGSCYAAPPPPPPIPPPHRPGGFKIWFFWDKDQSGSWTAGDEYLPNGSDVLTNSQFTIDVAFESRHYEYSINSNDSNDTWLMIADVHGCDGIFWGNVHRACGYFSQTIPSVAVCDVDAICIPGDNNSHKGKLLTMDNAGTKIMDNFLWSSTDLFYTPVGQGTFSSWMIIGPRENIFHYTTGATFRFLIAPGWEITVLKTAYKTSEGGSTTVESWTDGRNIIYGNMRYDTEYSFSRLFAVGLTEVNDPPMVISHSGSETEICNVSPNRVNFTSTFFDVDAPENPGAGEIDTDLRAIQFNLENEDDTTYTASLWPLRLYFDRNPYNGSGADSFHILNGDVSSHDFAAADYDSTAEVWYLPNDIALNDGSATLKGGQENGAYLTWFKILGSTNLYIDWTVDFTNDFPSGDYTAALYVEDLAGQQDEVGDFKLFLNNTWYFHLFEGLNVKSPLATGNFYEDPEAIFTVTCSGDTTLVDMTGANLNINSTNSLVAGSSYSVVADACSDDDLYTLTLQIPTGNEYICACPNTSSYECTYPDVELDTPFNFYLQKMDLSNVGWWQVLGAGVYAQTDIASVIPDPTCADDPICQNGIFLRDSYSDANLLSSGFPIALNNISETSFIHAAEDDRDDTTAEHAHALNTTLSQFSYQYFYDKLNSEATVLSENNMPTISDTDTHVYTYDGEMTIDETNGWNVDGDKSIVVLVNGNLIIDDADPADTTQIITVEEGSFLAFIANGSITITKNVGADVQLEETLNIDKSMAHVQGVFITSSSGQIIVEGNGTGDTGESDKKFIGAGTFVGWGGIDLQRDFTDDRAGASKHSTNPTETFIYRPDFVVNFPNELKDFLSNWREVNPSWE